MLSAGRINMVNHLCLYDPFLEFSCVIQSEVANSFYDTTTKIAILAVICLSEKN